MDSTDKPHWLWFLYMMLMVHVQTFDPGPGNCDGSKFEVRFIEQSKQALHSVSRTVWFIEQSVWFIEQSNQALHSVSRTVWSIEQ